MMSDTDRQDFERDVERTRGLIRKAMDANKSDDALRYSQAALNCAHAIRTLVDAKGVRGS